MRLLIVILLFMFCTTRIQAQQLKYKDLYELLRSGNYKLCEPFLRNYLKTAQHNPSALIYMGKIFEEKISSSTDQQTILSNLDSALLFYRAAHFGLTEGEINQNQEYYKEYQRRDLRTGKYSVKLSYIQMDVEGRIDNLNAIRRAIELPVIQRMLDENEERTIKTANKSLIKADGKYYALIMGVSFYDSSQLNLDRPGQDAKQLQDVLHLQYMFERDDIYLLINPSRQQILMTLYNLRRRITSNDNLLIFYAGHGFWDIDANQGYWWPRDASSDNPSNWLSNSDIREQIRGIKSAHTLLISDACFSGGIFKARGVNPIREAPLDIISLYKLPSRRAITSGTLTEVPDKSVFFDYLLKRLKQNNEQYLSSQSLFDSFRKAVINNSLIVPQDGVIADTGDEGGDFIFIKRELK